jgi:cellulose synthase/poly-beta-1,6-N-acetylglucosamine synthase-like glycosyltransferase
MSAILSSAAVVIGLPGAGTAVHLGVLALASVFYRSEEPSGPVPPVRFMVLVPAHNEEKVISRTLAALFEDRRPGDEVLVVADRCTDATADMARKAGALVLERHPGQEPGRAAARQDGVRYALEYSWEAMVMIDADSVIEPGFFTACEAALASGAEALQARSEAALGSRAVDQAAVAAFAMQGVLMPRGRDRLGLLVRLRGTGMVLSRRAVSEAIFRAPASEDLWYSLDLCLRGMRLRHVDNARLRSLGAGSWRVAQTQHVRYEAGRISAALEFAGPLLRRRDRASLEAAWFLLTPPFAVAALSLTLATGLAVVAGSTALTAIFGGLLGTLAGALVVGLLEARVGPRTWLALAVAPWYVPWKALIQLRALVNVKRGVKLYGATPR